jgi:hypothetical protein
MSYNFVNTSTQYISGPYLSFLTLYPSTFSAWVYMSSRASAAITILAIGSSSNANAGRILISGSGTSYAPGINSNQYLVSNINTVGSVGTSLNTWHHICGLFTSSTSRTIYLDGVSTGTSTTASSPNGLNSIRIGAGYANDGTPSTHFLGRISDTAIWSDSLSDSEITSLSKGFSSKKIRPQSLEFYCPLVRDLNEQILNTTLTNNNTATVSDHNRIYS